MRRNETKEITDKGEFARPSCVLQGTTAEFERSSQLAKIKAIRGLSPNKDIEVKLSDKSSSLLASKLNFDCRFKAIDQSTLAIDSVEYDFMRVRESIIYSGSSAQFKDIIIINSIENDVNFVILIPKTRGQITLNTMHENVANGLKTFKESNCYQPGEKSVWMP